jgi:hypothetical protein
MTRDFMIWWLKATTGFICLGTGILYFDGLNYLLEKDGTKISIGIILLMITVTLHIGYRIFHKNKDFDTAWFLADSCMSLGMIGTMLGFIMMLHQGLSNIDATDAAAMQSLIGSMAYGMSTALLTTLAGLVASLFLKIQIVVQEHLDA